MPVHRANQDLLPMRVYITPEISQLLDRMLRKLSLFENADVVFATDLLREKHKDLSLLESIYDYKPTMVITRSDVIARDVTRLERQPKVVLLHTHDYDTHQKFWLNAYYLDGFIGSTDKVFEIR